MNQAVVVAGRLRRGGLMSECLSGCMHGGRVVGHDEGGMAFAGYGTLVLRVRGHTSRVC